MPRVFLKGPKVNTILNPPVVQNPTMERTFAVTRMPGEDAWQSHAAFMDAMQLTVTIQNRGTREKTQRSPELVADSNGRR